MAGLIVAQRPRRDGCRRLLIVPSSAVRALGPDAITVHYGDGSDCDLGQLAPLPRLSQVLGRKVVGDRGTVLGMLDNVQIDARDGRILGYPLRAAHFLKRPNDGWPVKTRGASVELRWGGRSHRFRPPAGERA